MASEMVTRNASMYVSISTVTKNASIIVIMFCILSLTFDSLSHFQMVHPFVAVILIISAGWFYWMGFILKKKE